MILNLRQIKSRIKSIESTKKITRAMEMVSSSKLNRIKNILLSTKSYLNGIEDILKHSVTPEILTTHPFFVGASKVKRIAICVISADTGLCGPYNQNILREAEKYAEKNSAYDVSFVTVGKEAYNYFSSKKFRVAHSYSGLFGRYSTRVADEIADDLIKMYQAKEVDQVYIIHTRFSPRLRHAAVTEKFLSIDLGLPDDKNYLFEPSRYTIVDAILPRYLSLKMRATLLDAFTSEHSSRMLAMKIATDNAEELIDTLTLLRNKARQSAITSEVLDIALSAEALKG